MEARVESIGDDGRATGSACLRTVQGGIRGARLEDGRARVSDREGRIVQVRFGQSRFTARVLPNGALAMTERRPNKQNGTERLSTRLNRTETLQCAQLFAPAGNELDPEVLAHTDGITGYWTTGERPNGNVLELAVLKVPPRGKGVRGYRCLANHVHKNIRATLIGPAPETGPSPKLRGAWDHKKRTLSLTFEAKRWGGTGAQRAISELDDPPGTAADRLHMTATDHIGTKYETTQSLTLHRGTHPRGCLAAIHVTQPGGED